MGNLNEVKAITNPMTDGSVFKPLIKFTVPMFFSYIIEQLYTTVDSIIVGQYVGANGLAAIGITSQIISLTVSVSMGLISGISTIISEYYGGGKHRELRSTVAISAWVIIATYLIKVVIAFFAPNILALTNAPRDGFDDGVLYLRIIFYGGAFTFAYSMFIFLLRACGDSIKPLIFMIISSFMNVALDLLFVGKMNMGIGGAAFATVISQSFTAIACLIYMRQKMKILWISRDDFKSINKALVKYVLRLSLPSSAQSGTVMICAIIVQSVINSYGTYVVAGYVAAQKIENLVYMFFLSLTASLATFVSQNRGAGRYSRIQAGSRIIVIASVVLASTLGTVCYFFGKDLIGIFISGGEIHVVNEGYEYLKITCAFYFIGALWQSNIGVLRGMADAKTPIILGIMQVAASMFGILLLKPIFGKNGIWLSVSISWTLCAIISYIRMKIVLSNVIQVNCK